MTKDDRSVSVRGDMHTSETKKYSLHFKITGGVPRYALAVEPLRNARDEMNGTGA